MIAALLLLVTIDLVGIGKRYLTDENFQDQVDYDMVYKPNNADNQIKRDPGFFRVLNLAYRNSPGEAFQVSVNQAFNDGISAYHHNLIGGYSPAKLSIYADLVEKQLYKNIQNWGGNSSLKDSFRVLNMLNMKYVIVPDRNNPKETMAIPNPFAMGNCWLVKELKYVKNADEEMAALDVIDPATTAVLQEKFKSNVTAEPVYDSAASIKLIVNNNDYIKYDFNAASNQFAVFSEIYYSKAWKAYVDNKEVPISKVNYVLRGISVPAGKHLVEFKFDSPALNMAEIISKISQLLSILVVLLGVFMIWKNCKKEDGKG